MKIIVLYNIVKSLQVGAPTDILADEDTIKTAQSIAKAVSGELFEINEQTTKQLQKLDADLFFNAAFGIGSAPKSEAEVATLLEKTGKPYTGADAKNIILTTDKTATKEILLAAGLPTPKFQKKIKFPAMVKPNSEDCSLGITNASVVKNKKELDKQVDLLKKTYCEQILVEEYIDGRELNVTVLGNGKNAKVLPISEIVFGKSFKNKYHLVDFAAKWEEETANFKETVGVCPAKMSKELKEKIEDISLKAFGVTGCRDYARVDLRLDKNNQPWILEVNANPGIGPSDGVIRSARAAGYSYPGFLQKLVSLALAR